MKIDIKKMGRKNQKSLNKYKMGYAKDINFINFEKLNKDLSKDKPILFLSNPDDKMTELRTK